MEKSQRAHGGLKETQKSSYILMAASAFSSSVVSGKHASACTRAVTEMEWPWGKEEGVKVSGEGLSLHCPLHQVCSAMVPRP